MVVSQPPTLAQTLLKKSIWLYIFGYAIAPIGYFIKILVSGNVSVSDLGILYGIISLVTLVTAFSDLGMSEMLKYYIPKYESEKKWSEIKSILLYSFLTQLLTGLFLAMVFFWGADWLGNHYFKSESAVGALQVFSLFFFGINIFQIIITYFLAIQNTFWYKLLEFIRMLLIFGATLIFALQDVTSVSTYASAWIIGLYGGVVVGVSVFFARVSRESFARAPLLWSAPLAKEIFSYSILTFISAQASIILSQIDMQMIILMLSTESAGYYSVYISLIMIPFLIVGPIFPLLVPLFSGLYARNATEKIEQLKSFFQKYLSVIGLYFGVFLFLFGVMIASVLFGNTFLDSGVIVAYSSLFLLWNFLLQINFSILSGIGKVSVRLKIILASIGVNIILNYFFISMLGVSGAALATGIGWAIIFFSSEFYVGKLFPKKYDWSFLGKNIVLIAILFFISKVGITYVGGVSPSRIENFWIILGFGLLWTTLFIVGNYREGHQFFGEIKKLRTRKKAS